MNFKKFNEALTKLLKEENTEDLLSFAYTCELLKSDGDFDDYLCSDPDKGFCITSITYEYEEPQINFQTEWYPTKEEAKRAYEEELGIRLD